MKEPFAVPGQYSQQLYQRIHLVGLTDPRLAPKREVLVVIEPQLHFVSPSRRWTLETV